MFCFLVQLFWNESGELLAISTDESYFILRYSPEAVEKARQNPENMTEDGIEEAFDVSLSLLSLRSRRFVSVQNSSEIPSTQKRCSCYNTSFTGYHSVWA